MRFRNFCVFFWPVINTHLAKIVRYKMITRIIIQISV
jgi:hypothetical protein